MLVICQMLNLASRDRVRPLIEPFFGLWPHAMALATADPDDVEKVIASCGLGRQRSVRLIALSKAYLRTADLNRETILNLPGCGTYAADAFELFCCWNPDVTPDDGVLVEYKEHLVREGQWA